MEGKHAGTLKNQVPARRQTVTGWSEGARAAASSEPAGGERQHLHTSTRRLQQGEGLTARHLHKPV